MSITKHRLIDSDYQGSAETFSLGSFNSRLTFLSSTLVHDNPKA